jgi:uncharacterized membrane protein YagU involved in acid resistance
MEKSKALQAIAWGGLLAGVMDISAAFVTWGLRGISPVRILQSIASGLLGANAYQGGLATATLGAALHFLIATTATAVYYLASRKLSFLTQRAVIWGLLYGVTVYMFMYLVVQPLAGMKSRFTLSAVAIAVMTHIFCVGLPISLTVRRFSTPVSK